MHGKEEATKDEILDLLGQAGHIIKTEDGHRAGWRLVDAVGLLKVYLEKKGHTDVMGLHHPTGRGLIITDTYPERVNPENRNIIV